MLCADLIQLKFTIIQPITQMLNAYDSRLGVTGSTAWAIALERNTTIVSDSGAIRLTLDDAAL